MAEAMLQLGAYQFAVSAAAYQDLTRRAEYRWAAQERVGATDALQFTGFTRGLSAAGSQGSLGSMLKLPPRYITDLAIQNPLSGSMFSPTHGKLPFTTEPVVMLPAYVRRSFV